MYYTSSCLSPPSSFSRVMALSPGPAGWVHTWGPDRDTRLLLCARVRPSSSRRIYGVLRISPAQSFHAPLYSAASRDDGRVTSLSVSTARPRPRPAMRCMQACSCSPPAPRAGSGGRASARGGRGRRARLRGRGDWRLASGEHRQA